jgi:dTDP-4-amino-4,6-dideoxygalactose transaminase
VRKYSRHVNEQYYISAQKRDELKHQVENDGIRGGIYHSRQITENAPLRPYVKSPLPHEEAATREVLSLSVHPALSENDLGRIIQSVKGFYT